MEQNLQFPVSILPICCHRNKGEVEYTGRYSMVVMFIVNDTCTLHTHTHNTHLHTHTQHTSAYTHTHTHTHICTHIHTSYTYDQVTIFSDPMVNALTSLANKNNPNFYNMQLTRGQYVPIPGRYVYMGGLECEYPGVSWQRILVAVSAVTLALIQG